ncbi:MAG TPA: DUF4010 domain-containing protein [Terriglobales bacterium]|nr:DUF4010 domain-containing protein [Terriglobales bacterium]
MNHAWCFLAMFPPVDIAGKVALSLAVGLLVGLEREWAQKDLGVRTFTIACLFGMLSSLLGAGYGLMSLVGAFLLIVFVNVRSLLNDRTLEITTSSALMVTTVLGILIGQGHLFTPVASAILVTMLLAWKAELRKFAGGLTLAEIRSAVLIGLLGFVIYPVLPDRFVDRWSLLNPREAWVVIVVLAGIGFVNYVLLRAYGARGIYYTALLGGLVNSTATVAEMCPWLAQGNEDLMEMAVAVVLLTNVAMFLRNLAILALFSPKALTRALWPLLAMAVVSAAISWNRYRRNASLPTELKISSPLSWARISKFGALFLLIQIAGDLAQRHLGELGFLALSVVGGLVSSASTTAAAALLVSRGQLTTAIGGTSVVLCSLSSALVDLPLVYQETRRNTSVIRSVAIASLLVAAVGLIGLAVTSIR